MALPDEVDTDRLRLSLITAAEAQAMRAGQRSPHWHPDYPRQDDLDGASMQKDGDPWRSRHVVRRSDGLAVGSIGFFGPPVDVDGVPEAEVGYGLVADARGAGLATEALRALLAEADREGVRVRASVEPDNTASLRVLAKCGFTEIRGTTEDGELVLVRPAPGVPA